MHQSWEAWEDEQQALAREQDLRQNEARLLHAELELVKAASRALASALERAEAALAKAEKQREEARALAEHHRQRCAVLRAERIPEGWAPVELLRDDGRVRHSPAGWEWEAWSDATKKLGGGTSPTLREACRASDAWRLRE